jgi:hypothetical protein
MYFLFSKHKETTTWFLCTSFQKIMLKMITIITCSLMLAHQVTAQQSKPLQTPAQSLIANTGEDSMNAYGASHARTVISGYGEVTYQRNFNAQQSTASLKRAVLFVGHQFTGRIAFFSELEVEDAKVEAGGATGEVGMEQAYLKFSLNPRQYLVAGLFIPRIGIVNENHLPINFNGVERPLVEQLVIPSTWREIGVGFYGQTSSLPLTYSIALVNGLNNATFAHGEGIRGGRAEGQMASANNMAVTAAVQYFAGNWKFQVSGYAGGTTTLGQRASDSLQLESGVFGTPLYLAEADIQYANRGISFKALGCNISIPKASSINRAFDNNVPEQIYGAYAELGYNLLNTAKAEKWKTKQLNIFARYELFDLNAKIPDNGIIDGTEQQSHIIAGIGYMPIPHVIIKADVRLLNTGQQNSALLINPNPNALPYKQNNSFLNIGIGYSF